MKKMIPVLFAAAALVGVGVAQADQGACVTRGMCDNVSPEHGGDANGNYDVRLAEQRGLVAPGTAQAYYDNAYAAIYGVEGGGQWAQAADGRWTRRHGYAAPYARTNRDRDGDRVPNNRDRYPDDPRYH